MSQEPVRPRLAIIGGGGAMGRHFARLMWPAVRELYLFDFFDGQNAPSILAKTLDDIRLAAEAKGQHWHCSTLTHGPPGSGWTMQATAALPGRGRALLRLTKDVCSADAGTGVSATDTVADLVAALDSRAVSGGEGCLVFAGLPDDAAAILPRADVSLLAIGLNGGPAFAATVRHYARWFQPSSLVVGLASTQRPALRILREELSPSVGVLGAHPLFGPAVADPTGLIVAVVDPEGGRDESPWRPWFLEQLARLRLIVTPTSAKEHDDAMSFVQALSHFALLSFANTFVRLNRDPTDLLALRTPVFEPLLYLAARVAYQARLTPDTYRSIQTHVARPEVRTAFLEAAREILDAVETSDTTARESSNLQGDPVISLFQRYGSPWSADHGDRRDRQRREHFLEMGARLVDGLNRLRQEIVAAAGQVRAIEDRRAGLPPRVLIGVVDLDLRDPGKQDVASRVRLRPLNLLLGSIKGGDGATDGVSHDLVVPLARARLLTDAELLDWLLDRGELVERRVCQLIVPDWFDRDVLRHLLKGFSGTTHRGRSQVWEIAIDPLAPESGTERGQRPARVTFTIVLHPAELVDLRRQIVSSRAPALDRERATLETAIRTVYAKIKEAHDPAEREALAREKDRLKRQRKLLLDRRTADIDREVRRLTRARVQAIVQDAVDWLCKHGCSLPG